jgi:hypothetical protein
MHSFPMQSKEDTNHTAHLLLLDSHANEQHGSQMLANSMSISYCVPMGHTKARKHTCSPITNEQNLPRTEHQETRRLHSGRVHVEVER